MKERKVFTQHHSKPSVTSPPALRVSKPVLARMAGKPVSAKTLAVTMRPKVVKGLQECLQQARSELQAAGRPNLPPPNSEEDLARAIEEAMYIRDGGYGEAYKLHYQSLKSNLRDAQNTELRAQVLMGQITSQRLVELSSDELANKELAAWRQSKLEERDKQTVLDEVKVQNILGLNVVADSALDGKGQRFKGGAGRPETGEGEREKREDLFMAAGPTNTIQDTEHVKGVSLPSTPAGGAVTGGAEAAGVKERRFDQAVNWEMVQQMAATVTEQDEEDDADDDDGDGYELMDQPMIHDEKAGTTRSHGDGHARDDEATDEDADHEAPTPSSRSKAPSSASGNAAIIPSLVGLFTAGRLSHRAVKWSGQLEYLEHRKPVSGTLSVAVREIAGTGPMAGHLPRPDGRAIAVDKVIPAPTTAKYFSQLRASSSRTCTVGLLTGALDAHALRLFVDKGHTAHATPGEGLELYLIPQGSLAIAVLAAARDAISSTETADIPSDAPGGTLVAVLIHKKSLAPRAGWDRAGTATADGPSDPRRPRSTQVAPNTVTTSTATKPIPQLNSSLLAELAGTLGGFPLVPAAPAPAPHTPAPPASIPPATSGDVPVLDANTLALLSQTVLGGGSWSTTTQIPHTSPPPRDPRAAPPMYPGSAPIPPPPPDIFPLDRPPTREETRHRVKKQWSSPHNDSTRVGSTRGGSSRHDGDHNEGRRRTGAGSGRPSHGQGQGSHLRDQQHDGRGSRRDDDYGRYNQHRSRGGGGGGVASSRPDDHKRDGKGRGGTTGHDRSRDREYGGRRSRY